MNAPIRIVCEGCLRSVERDADQGATDEAACPFCGYRFESRLIGSGSSEDPTHVPGRDSASETVDGPGTIDWTAAWTRGTLGSLGRFQLRERLGDGGFGEVYLAYDPRLDRDVAIKVLKQPNPSDRVMERFFREARAVARLDHPNIVAVHDAGFDDGRCWVAYQLVSGRPLWWYRDRQRMIPATAARIIRDLADALSHAHALAVVHRDIKPGNILIDDLGRPRLIDFGLARRSDLDSDLTRDGVIVGTPAYMSPEQAIGLSRQADERSDVYSLGVIFYELLCRRRPVDLSGRTDSGGEGGRAASRPAPVPSARSINPAVPKALDDICRKAMCPRPDGRYPTARALADAIDQWLARRRRGLRPLLSIGFALLLAVGVGLAAGLNLRPDAPSRVAPADLAARPATPGAEGDSSASPLPPPGQAARTPTPAGLVRSGRFVYNLQSRKYHRSDCPHRGANPIEFASPGRIQELDLQPCRRCKPQETEPDTPATERARPGPG